MNAFLASLPAFLATPRLLASPVVWGGFRLVQSANHVPSRVLPVLTPRSVSHALQASTSAMAAASSALEYGRGVRNAPLWPV